MTEQEAARPQQVPQEPVDPESELQPCGATRRVYKCQRLPHEGASHACLTEDGWLVRWTDHSMGVTLRRADSR